MSCKRQTNTNNNESILFNSLLELAGNDELLANRYYSQFKSENFINQFGNYEEDYQNDVKEINQDRVDDNGEPKLFKDENYNRHYYLNKNNEKVFFPEKGLIKILTSNSINKLKKTLGAQYIKNNFRLVEQFEDLDFNQTSNTNISKFIEDSLNNKLKELSNIGTPIAKIKSQRITKLLGNIDEIKDEVIDYFKSIKIKYNENENNLDDLNTIEDDTREHSFNVSSYERSYKENINSDVKLMLSLIPNVNEIDDVLDTYSFYTFEQVYGHLLQVLNNIVVKDNENKFNEFIRILEKEKEFQPFIKDVLNILESTDKPLSLNTKNKFVQAFDLSKNEFYTIEVDKDYNKENILKNYNQKTLPITEANSKASRILEEWGIKFNDIYLNKKDFKYEKFKLTSDKINNFKQEFNTKIVKEDLTSAELLHKLNPLVNILNDLGLVTTEKGLNYFLRSNLEDIYDVESIKLSVNSLINKLQYFSKSIQNKTINPLEGNSLRYENIFKNLANSEAKYYTEGSESSIFQNGKTKWSFSKPDYLTIKIEKWKKYPELIKEHLESTPFNKRSRLLNYLLATDLDYLSENEKNNVIKERLENFNIGIFNNLQETEDFKNAVDNKEITTNDEIASYVNNLLSFIKNVNPIVRTVTPADKSQQKLIEYPKEIFVESNYDSENDTINDEAIEVLYNYFVDEYDRMNKVAYELKQAELSEDNSKLYIHYHLGNKNGLKSSLFPSLSVDFKKGKISNLPKIQDLKGNDIILYDSKTGYPVMNSFSNRIKESIKEHIRQNIKQNISSTLKTIQDIELLKGEGRLDTENYAIDSAIYQKYTDRNQLSSYKIREQIAADIYINGLISQVEYSKAFAGDYAYYKNMVDYKKRIPATYTDGQYLNTNDKYFNIASITSVEGGSPFLNFFQELVDNKILKPEIAANYIGTKNKITYKGKEYVGKDVNIADAQAWITPQRWKFIMNGLGKWNNNYEHVYHKLTKTGEALTEKELKFVLQPLKGVYFDVKDGVPTMLKYSQAVLIPSLVKGTSLQKMYNEMTKSNDYNEQIHEVITLDGIKVGSLNTTQLHNEDDATEINNDFTLNKQQLLNSGWKLQQDLPTKGVHNTDVGSQIQKNVFQGLSFNLDKMFNYKGEAVSGDQLSDIIHEIVGKLSDKGVKRLKKELGIDENGVIKNVDLFYNSLADQLIEQDGNKNIINALKAQVNPIGIPQAYSKIMNMFASIVLDRVVKIKTNGGSFIQMSDFGLNRTEASEKGILWTPWSEEKVHPYTLVKDDIGNIVLGPNGKPLIRPAGILIPGSLIAKYIPNYKEYKSEQLFGTLNKETGEYEGGLIDYKILTNIIGYRIPNQGISSNDAFHIAGILPEEMGDTIVAYTGITTKTGSDFDIDKMYMMIPSFYKNYNITKKVTDYVYKNLVVKDNLGNRDYESTLDNIETILNQINPEYDKGLAQDLAQELLTVDINDPESFEKDTLKQYISFFIDAIKDAKKSPLLDYIKESMNLDKFNLKYSNSLENDLIEAYKAVFTHPDVLNDVMTPIDFDFYKNDIIAFNKEDETGDTYHFDGLKDIYIKAQYKAGKAGVGMEANSLMDHVRGTMANLRFKNYYLGAGFKNELGETKFDEEFSQELSDEDLKLYLKKYNEVADEKITMSDLESLKKIKIANSLSAILNAFVDIAKDPYITRGNWNTATTNVGNMLLRAGVHPFQVNAFLKQPILKSFIEFQNNKESKINNDTGNIENKFKLDILRNSKDFKIELQFGDRYISVGELHKLIYKNHFESDYKALTYNEIYSKLQSASKFVTEDGERTKKSLFTKEQILTHKQSFDRFVNIVSTRQISFIKSQQIEPNYFPEFNSLMLNETPEFQMKVLSTFFKLKEDAKKMKKNIDGSTSDVSGLGSTITSLIAKNNTINDLLNNNEIGQLLGFETKLNRNGKPTLLGHYTTNSVIDMIKVVAKNPKLFFMAQSSIVNNFDIVSNDIKGTKLLDEELGKDLELKYLSYVLSGFEGIKTSHIEYLYLTSDDFVKEFNQFKESKSNRYSILNELNLSKNKNNKLFITLSNRKKSSEIQQELTKSWLDMLNSDKEMAEKLVKYSFITSGFNMNKGQFFTLIPNEFFIEKDINGYLNSRNIKHIDNNFIEQLYQNNWDNSLYVPNVFNNQILRGDKNFGFVLDFKNQDKIARRYVKQKSNLYKLIGYDINRDPIYVRTYTKGYKDDQGNKYYEYSFDENNRALLSDIANKEGLVKYYNETLLPQVAFDIDSNELERSDLSTKEDIITEEKEIQNNKIETPDLYKRFGVKAIEVINRYSIDDVKANPDKIYVFGDNIKRTGTGGQAIIRNMMNTSGIATKLIPSNSENSFMSDNDFENNKKIIDKDIERLIEKSDEKIIVFPKDGLGTGLAKLKEKAPQTYQYLKEQLLENFGFDNDTGQINNLSDNSEQVWNEIQDKWNDKYGKEGKAIFDAMTPEEREQIIKNCL